MDKAFDCKMCGHCCQGQGGIVMDAEDERRLAGHLDIDVDGLARYTEKRNGKVCLTTDGDGLCVFYREGCSVHPGKPDICRAWPFFRGNLIDETSWRMAQEYCPGINPKVEHAEFVRQGIEYLRECGLLDKTAPGGPNALKLTP